MARGPQVLPPLPRWRGSFVQERPRLRCVFRTYRASRGSIVKGYLLGARGADRSCPAHRCCNAHRTGMIVIDPRSYAFNQAWTARVEAERVHSVRPTIGAKSPGPTIRIYRRSDGRTRRSPARPPRRGSPMLGRCVAVLVLVCGECNFQPACQSGRRIDEPDLPTRLGVETALDQA